MASHHPRSGPPTSAEAIWHSRRVKQLEAEIGLLKEQLSSVSVKNAHNLLFLSQVYNITLLRIDSAEAIASIKKLMEKNIKSIMTAATVATGGFSSSGSGQTVTPPSTGPASERSDNVNSGDEGDDSSHHDLLSSSTATEMNKSIVAKVIVPKKDIKKSSEQVVKMPVKQQIKQVASASHFSHSQAKQQAKQLAKSQSRANPQGSVKPKHAGGQIANGVVEKNKDSDDIWQEFSLEEELEGIADAPAMSRAAMRAVLREKEEANRKRMRESADEKRRIAEQEGHILKQTFLRPADPVVMPNVEMSRSFDYAKPDRRNGKSVERNTTEYHAGPATPPEALVPVAAVPVVNPLANEKTPVQTPKLAAPASLRTKIVDVDSDIDEIYQSSGIINVEYGSPKNADRFGIVFNPSKLGPARVAEVTGTRNGDDNRRSVLVQNIPPEFSMHKLLAHVRGGKVVIARLVPDTMGPGQGQVAMITFTTAEEAANCKAITSKLLAHSEKWEGFPLSAETKMTISLLPTPTYPSRETIVSAGSAGTELNTAEEKTRCVIVDGFPKGFINDLSMELLLGPQGFPTKNSILEEMWFAGDNLHMQFTNTQEAEKAHRIASIFHFKKYAAHVRFGPDPCAGKVDSNNFGSLFNGNGIKLASHGYMGLKPLLETVGLASFARSHAEVPVLVKTEKRVAPLNFGVLLRTAREVTQGQDGAQSQACSQAQGSSDNSNSLIDLSFDAALDYSSSGRSSTAVPNWDVFSSRSCRAPWTAHLMTGLDNF
ncbi:hypothetical protein Sste5346_005002 [Sporothrix stenoceras]|uniref:RRM domain-containing protein n=1 Tax=Sporothrix stenoceras TaxID=5173 RepID=A0ABR3Z6K4_9PEZI